jgi:hypothetical protein
MQGSTKGIRAGTKGGWEGVSLTRHEMGRFGWGFYTAAAPEGSVLHERGEVPAEKEGLHKTHGWDEMG